MGQTREHPLRPDWLQVKDIVMYEGLRHKFTQNSDLKNKLLSTGNKKIVEHT